LNSQDVLSAAKSVETAVQFGSGPDGLLVNEPSFLDVNGNRVPGFRYRPQDEYLEWASQRDADGTIREVWFTCEGPEYWSFIAQHDWNLLLSLYADLLQVPKNSIDETKLRFPQRLTRKEAFSGSPTPTVFEAESYNPYNDYNISGAVHLTQGANSLGAEVTLAMQGSLIWGNPPKTADPDLICCASYGSPNRFSDPTIGKEVNDLARQRMFVTLRDPIGLYIATIAANNFTDWNGNPIDVSQYFIPSRKSADGSMILRAAFKVPSGVLKNGVQARVGDLNYLGKPIVTGGQIAHAITMHLFAQALPGAPVQNHQSCIAHPCNAPGHPGFIIPTPVEQACPTALNQPLAIHLMASAPTPQSHPSRLTGRPRRALRTW
jgi:hypothetical protein